MKKLILAGIVFLVMCAVNLADAAEIRQGFYNGDPEIKYPIVKVENAKAERKINVEILKEVQKFVNHVGENPRYLHIDYEVPHNDNGGILSIILTESAHVDKAAHPWLVKTTLNFNSDSGARITAQDLSEIAKHDNDYTPEELTRKLKLYAKINNIPLRSDFKQLTKTPEDFYFDDNMHVHFFFQKGGEELHYAVGFIDLDADAMAGIVDTMVD